MERLPVPWRDRPAHWRRRAAAWRERRQRRGIRGEPRPPRGGAAERRRRRRVMLAAAAAAVVALLVWAFWPAPVPVETGTVVRGTLQVTVDDEGTTRARNRLVVAAPVTGELRRIPLDEGDPVAAGAAVAVIEPALLDPRERQPAQARAQAAEAAAAEARAAVEHARAARDQALRDLGRAERLTAAGAMAQQELEATRLLSETRAAELEAAAARADAAALEAAAARAVLVGEPVPVRSPADGQVFRVVERGPRVVTAGTPLLEVGDARALELVVDVLSSEAVEVGPGDQIFVTEWGGPPLTGRVRRVEPSAFTVVSALGIEERRVQVIGDLVHAPPELGDGFRFRARIVVWEGHDELIVPIAALFRRDDRWHVFVVEGGRARLREVVIGRRSEDHAQVLDGLVAGETVILRPDEDVDDGTRVEDVDDG